MQFTVVIDGIVPVTPPVITTHPTSQNLQVGQTLTIRVVATGTGLTYQ
jgi:hypothetical protein